MSKTATTPPKKTTTASSSKERKTAKPAAKRAPVKPAPVRKPSPTSKAKASADSYKKPTANPRVTHGLPSGYSKPATKATKTHGLPDGSAPAKAPRKPKGSAAAPAPKSAPLAEPPPQLPREGFRRASVTFTATVSHAEGHPSHQTGLPTHQNALPAHKTGTSMHHQPGTLHGTQGAAHVPDASQAAPGLDSAGTPATKPLTFIEQRYCFEYVQDGNQTRAYMRATGTTHLGTAANAAWKLMKKEEIRAQIEVERAALQARAGVTTEDWLRMVWGMCKADPRELVEYFVGACRYCHGEGHRYHRTAIEYERDRKEFESHGRQRIDGLYLSTKKAAERKAKRKGAPDEEEEFDHQGGPGYDPKAKPHEDCPQCFGNGHGRTIIKDTRLISADAALLYAGVKEGKEGIEVKLHSKMDALEKLAKYLGAYDADNRQKDRTDAFTAMLEHISGPGAALPINQNPQEGD